MTLPKELTTVTTLSKAVALIMFITLPIVTFLYGMRYQALLLENNVTQIQAISPTPEPIGCTEEAKMCPDGSAVGRVGPDCEFEECPQIKPQGTMCGGIAGLTCPEGSYCKYEGTYPDAAGTCIKTSVSKYSCPNSEYVDCMPGPGQINQECSTDFLKWAQGNCPNFKGAAL